MMYKTRYNTNASKVNNYYIKSWTACGKMTRKENLKLSNAFKVVMQNFHNYSQQKFNKNLDLVCT